MQDKKQFSLIIGDRRLPLDIHAVAFDEPGGVAGLDRPTFTFRFAYRHIPITARFSDHDDCAAIELQGDVGPMPFSAESWLARAELQTVLDAANAHLGEVFRLVDGRILVVGSVPVADPVTAVGLVTAITHFLVPVKPYLETIAVFLAPPGEAAASGEALRPGWRRIVPGKR